MSPLRFLLLQIRNHDDPIREHEIACFARAIGCDQKWIVPYDLITSRPDQDTLDQNDAVLIGGSGDYSVVTAGDWFNDSVNFFRNLYDQGKPTFASCWGFQALAKALGGKVVTDLQRAEVGTQLLTMTRDGLDDPIFGPLGESFYAQIGHQDIVDRLPTGAVLLSSSERVTNQAFKFSNKPIYATQFHPELERDDLVKRLVTYPEYVEKISGMDIEEFIATCRPTPANSELLQRFVIEFLR